MEDENESFVYEGIEVVKTGRVAQRQLKRSNTYLTLVEITPKQHLGSWVKWINPDELFHIIT